MAAKAQSKHENFLKKTSTAVGYTIIGLDYYIEDYQVTLRQAIMSIRSTTEPDYNLFTAVDDMSYSNRVVFAFRKSFEAEAAAAIPGLPLILEGYYGHKVWTWFSEEAKQETEAFEWDPQQGLIEKQEQSKSMTTTSTSQDGKTSTTITHTLQTKLIPQFTASKSFPTTSARTNIMMMEPSKPNIF